jgi:endogenous inhibitor of DNA gyrase (YacG/DUF329 family)|tara:strand:- start:94 stop:333 length:240 start_codon:yes stop_codon:yes gene_type:complete
MASESDTNSATSRPDGVRVTADECPRCGKAVAPRFRPFCSERCSDLDLAGWLTGKYRLPTEEVADPNDPSPVSEDIEGV